MDKVAKFFKNIWFKRSVSVLSLAYGGFLAWVTWLSTAYWLQFENNADSASLFTIYIFINLLGLTACIISRKVLLTKIVSFILPLFVFAIVILGFGNLYLILPAFITVVLIFFINSASETAKTVVGTIYLLVYFIGVVGYILYQMFITDTISLSGVDLSKRDTKYLEEIANGKYRVVRYHDSADKVNRKTTYRIEFNDKDIDIPFAKAMRVIDNAWLITVPYENNNQIVVKWDGKQLHIDDGSFDKVYTRIVDKNGDFDLMNNVDEYKPKDDGTSATNSTSKSSNTSNANNATSTAQNTEATKTGA